MKRTIEVFSAGCALCDGTAKLVQSMACSSCAVQVLDVRADPAAQAKAKQYGVTRVPSVVVNGNLADCCRAGAVSAAALRAAGVGVPA